MKKFRKKIKYDNKAILQQAQIYSDEYRVLMEYIDNSIDAAEQAYDKENNKYDYDIKISIEKSGGNILITDNCSGMNIGRNKPFTIFQSDKRDDPGTNGMFGFGLFSCFSICESLSVKTMKKKSNTEYSFIFTPRTFIMAKKDDIEFDLFEKTLQRSDRWNGTIVTLSKFKEDMLEDICFDKLKAEIEKHFELILMRENISITLVDEQGIESTCIPFNYSDYSVNPFQKTLTTLYQTNSKKFKTEIAIPIEETPVKIFLIAAKDTDLNRLPFFIIKGRRISEIAKVENFRTTKKSAIWSRPNVTGYIDVTGVLLSNPTRKDFSKTDLSKALFNTLLKEEEEIKNYIDTESEINLNNKFNDFESKINSVLNDFFKRSSAQDNLRNISDGYNEYMLSGYKTAYRNHGEINKPGSNHSSNKKRAKSERKRDHKFAVKFPNDSPEDSSTSGKLSVKIDSDNEPHKNMDGQPIRSILLDSSIIIFSRHEDFKERISNSRKGFIEINPRIIQYISMEIIIHIINNTDQEDTVDTSKYKNFVSSVLKLESGMKDLIGERL